MRVKALCSMMCKSSRDTETNFSDAKQWDENVFFTNNFVRRKGIENVHYDTKTEKSMKAVMEM